MKRGRNPKLSPRIPDTLLEDPPGNCPHKFIFSPYPLKYETIEVVGYVQCCYSLCPNKAGCKTKRDFDKGTAKRISRQRSGVRSALNQPAAPIPLQEHKPRGRNN